jgi:AcrR family transcriptional regulator
MENTQRRQRTIERLLDASHEVLVDVGYNRYRTADVAKRSAISEGSLFRYFPTKYDIIVATYERAANRYFDKLVRAFLGTPYEKPSFRQMLETLWQFLNENDLHWVYEIYSASQSDAFLRSGISSVRRSYNERVDSLAATVFKREGFPENEIPIIASIARFSMEGLRINEIGEDGVDVRIGKLIDGLLAMAEMRFPEIANADPEKSKPSHQADRKSGPVR